MESFDMEYVEKLLNEKKDQEAFDYCMEFANDGDAEALIGSFYYNGDVVEKDYKKAAKWYKKSAYNGVSIALRNLGVCYEFGQGKKKNLKKSVSWYTKAAKNGERNAMYLLGGCYQHGIGIETNYKTAFTWYSKGAHQGDSAAMWALGNCYKEGIGVKQDKEKAFNWYSQSADLDFSSAFLSLGLCYISGTGTKKDDVKAFMSFYKASLLGNVNAMFNIGLLYENGIGTEVDLNKAISFYRRAVEKGHKDAAKHLHKLERSMTINSELEEQINKLTEQLREKERESEARNQDSMILQIRSMMNSMESRLTARMDEISDTTNEINDNVKSLTDYIKNELPKKIASLRTEFGVDTLSETELTEADEKKIGEFCKTVRAVIEKQFDEKNDLIRQSRKDLSKRFGNVWNRLCQETQNSLVSGMTLWKAYKNIDDPNFDFSGICILATSALENELRKIFFEEFQEFVKNQTGGKINRYPSIFTYRKGTELVAGKSEYFSLGKMPFLFGQTGKDPSSEDLSDIKRLNDFREKYLESIIDSQKMIDSGFASFSECFTKPFFSKNSELKKEKNFHVYYKGSLISEFEDIRNKYRNKSAHQGGLRRDEARDCCNLVLGQSIMETAYSQDNDLEKVLGLIQKVYYLLKQ